VKINDSKNNPVNLGLDKAAVDKAATDKAEAASKQNSVSSGAKSEDNVTLSPMAQKINSLKSNIGAENVFDTDKVNEIKAAIMSGQFKVNTEKVADGLIQSVKDMLGGKP